MIERLTEEQYDRLNAAVDHDLPRTTVSEVALAIVNEYLETSNRSNMQRVDGVEYTPEAIQSIREMIIELRNAALDAERFDYGVGLSHALVYLSHYKKHVEAGNVP